MTWAAILHWLSTPLTLSYAQALGTAVAMVALVWLAGTFALWWLDAEQMIRTKKAIIDREIRKRDAVGEELHLCKRTLVRTTQELMVAQSKRAQPPH